MLKQGEQSNKRIWKALINPGPLLAKDFPGCYSSGSAEEAYLIVNYALKAFRKSKNVLKILKEFVGENNLEYDTEF